MAKPVRVYLNPKHMQNHGPKPMIKAIGAIILHTFGVQVGLGLGLMSSQGLCPPLSGMQPPCMDPSKDPSLAWIDSNPKALVRLGP